MPNQDWNVPYVNNTTRLTTKKANEEAFYASALSGSQDVVKDYRLANADLQSTGQSSFVDEQKAKWAEEDKIENQKVIQGILGDKTIPNSTKKAVVQNYMITGDMPTSLKDRYIKKTAAAPVQATIDDNNSQDAHIEVLGEVISKNNERKKEESVRKGAIDLMSALKYEFETKSNQGKALASILSDFGVSSLAGLAGIFTTIKEQDPDLAVQIIHDIKNLSYLPKEEAAKKIKQNMLDSLATLSTPSEMTGDFVNILFTAGITPRGEERARPIAAVLATTAQLVLDPINILLYGAGKGIRPTKSPEGAYTNLNTPKIPVDSPLETTNVANPQAAEKLAASALKDPTETTAATLGTNKGQIVHDWVLPKIFPEEVVDIHPDLNATLAKNDALAEQLYVDFRYDPSVINATRREEEVAKTFQIMKEQRGAYYNQSMSLVNETLEGFEGNAVLSRNEKYGWAKEADAQEAYNNLKQSIDQLPVEQRGNLSIVKYNNQYYLNWQWKKQFDELSAKVFGPESLKVKLFGGLDVSWLGRSFVGRWLFPSGKFDKWVEYGAGINFEQEARLEAGLTKIIKEHIAKEPNKVQLAQLIEEAGEKGLEYFSKEDISSRFPNLSSSAVDSLHDSHVFWRRQQHYNYNFMNRVVRNKLAKDEMQGIYNKEGQYLGAGTQKIPSTDLGNIQKVWDMDTGVAVTLTEEAARNPSKVLVRLNEKVKDGESIYHYALIGKNHQLNLLPQEVLPRIPGYSPRKVKENWYVDIVPTKLEVDGVMKYGKDLDGYVETKAAARSEHEGNKIAEQLQEEYPDYKIKVRPERSENFGRIMTDYGIHSDYLTHAMKRGERLPSLDAPARYEDPMASLIGATRNVANTGAWQAWDESFKNAFVKGYGDFLDKGQFPQYATDISPRGRQLDRAEKVKYDSAHQLFKYYERMKNFETMGDFNYTKVLNSVAPIFEKWKLTQPVADALHGKHTNPLMMGKSIGTTLFIHLNPLRQPLVQWLPQQLEMWALNPSTFKKNASNNLAIGMYLAAEAPMMKLGKDTIQANARSLGEMAGNKEFMADVEAIRKSGMLQGVDTNSIVHGILNNVDRNLIEGNIEKYWKDFEAGAKAVPRTSRVVGYDASEIANRIGTWLQVKELWKKKYPERNWQTKEAQFEISAEALRLSGGMNRGALLPYQEGILSIPLQFTAIQHKQLMNLIQDNTTILTGAERARLAAVRFALYGGKYGIPGGAAAYYFIDRSSDPEVHKNAAFIKRGLVDYVTNRAIAAFVEPDEKPDLAMSKMMSPYSEAGLPYFDFAWETVKLTTRQESHPRYPTYSMISSFGKAVNRAASWFQTEEINESNFKEAAMEVAELASGMSNFTKGLVMLGTRDRITKMGNKYGMEFTASEAYAKMMFGIGTEKEEDLWTLVQMSKDRDKDLANTAKDIYGNIRNQMIKKGDTDPEIFDRKLRRLINTLQSDHFSEEDKVFLIEKIKQMDREEYKSVKQSILMKAWQKSHDEATTENKAFMNKLRNSSDPETQKWIKNIDEGKL